MKEQNVYITNFTRLTANTEGGKYRVVNDADGKEAGIEVSGILTTFDVRNENGGVFESGSYDKFVDEYFVKNSLNVPLCIYHNDYDPRFVCGVVKELTKTDSGVEMVGWIPRTAYFYNLIKSQIDEGILQGFSNAGGLIKAKWEENEETGEWTVRIKDFALLHASLVCNPADTTARLRVENTRFAGFGPVANETNQDHKQEEQAGDDWRDIV